MVKGVILMDISDVFDWVRVSTSDQDKTGKGKWHEQYSGCEYDEDEGFLGERHLHCPD